MSTNEPAPPPALSSEPTAPGRARARLAAVLASLFAVWHGIAMLLGTSPPSYLQSLLLPPWRPYIEALHLDGRWGFFAPDPTAGRLLRYRIEAQPGAEPTEHPFTEALRRADPAYLRYTTLSSAVHPERPAVMRSVAHALCRRHGLAAPARIRFIAMQQVRVTPEDVEAGVRPLDPSQLHAEPLGDVECAP